MKFKTVRKIMILLFLVLTVFGIYFFFKSDSLNYIALGDSLAEGMNPYGEVGFSYTDFLAQKLKGKKRLSYYTKKYTKSGYTSNDLIANINVDTQIKRDLREADLVTISIGANDFLHKVDLKKLDVSNLLELKNVVDGIFPSIDECIKEIRKYAKEDIIIVGYYNPIPFLFNTSGSDLDSLFAYIDDEYVKIATRYDCSYVSLYQLFKNNSEFLPNPMDIHPSLNGYQKIAELVFDKINMTNE